MTYYKSFNQVGNIQQPHPEQYHSGPQHTAIGNIPMVQESTGPTPTVRGVRNLSRHVYDGGQQQMQPEMQIHQPHFAPPSHPGMIQQQRYQQEMGHQQHAAHPGMMHPGMVPQQYGQVIQDFQDPAVNITCDQTMAHIKHCKKCRRMYRRSQNQNMIIVILIFIIILLITRLMDK